MNISELCGLVIPTHMSQKGQRNKDWGPPTPGWVSETLSSLFERVPATQDLETWVVVNSHPGRPGNDEYISNLRIWCAAHQCWLHIDDSPGYRGVRCNMVDWFPKKYLFVVEHDWKFLQDVDLEAIIRAFEEHEFINYVRFNKRANLKFKKRTWGGRWGAELYCDAVDRVSLPLCSSPHYTNNPHIERVSKLREWVEIVKRRNDNAGGNMGAGGFEHPLQEESLDDLEKLGKEARDAKWGTYIYGQVGLPKVVDHFGV